MKTKHFGKWRYACVIVICIAAVLCAIAAVLCTISVISYANLFRIVYAGNPEAEAELDKNMYIHSNFAEWKEYKLTDSASIRIPQNWNIVWNENHAEITEDGKVIAYGIRQLKSLPWEGSRKEESAKFISETIGFEPIKDNVDEDYFYPHTGQTINLCKHSFQGDGRKTKAFYALSILHAEEYYYSFLFGPIAEEGDEVLLEKLIGVTFSYK